MKILFLANAASIHTVRWVNALVNKDHEVHLVFKADDDPKQDAISDKVILHRLKYSGTKGYFINAFELKRIFKVIKPDIVNAHYASGYGTLARLAKLTPLVLSVWGSDVYDFPYQSKFKRKLVVKNLLFADQIASTSHCMARQVKSLIGSNPKEIEVTPFGVDMENFSRKSEYEIKENVCIGNIKTLAPKYGITDLIKAIKILKGNLEDMELYDVSDKLVVNIYGDGEQKEEIASLISELNLTNTVKLKGRIPNSEVPQALENMDIFCLTSILDSESFGVAAVEAMAMELPVVATNVDGFKEVIEDGNTGIIVERENPLAVARALEKLVLDYKLRTNMGKEGRKRVGELFDWNKNVNKMLELYLSTSIKGNKNIEF